ncbi:hypothetical protein, conserved [Trypanosoma brucei gambiense DAL972]|uniref:Uncharacterized protein n=2 Tax=Trypanosoma brucei TaxID=5691 RepID=C9ZXF4_TRYB9|nr:hypothetical protein, conserved [Trypanosoma brucei gambiense DAL972]RHW70598.1 hypothetical protein DPX39_090011500 [Trypanosoma brucei equiperdum]CBH14098.1 hypothetical protein, conserved [Trypanosoma brucei gambiense DAL972]|eukprot:XP_011776369.1 hypothetical protein, conserved [Trypanosoma brucei gambiense DAL972]
MLRIRRTAFSFLGGFAIADFYVNCTNLDDIQSELGVQAVERVASPNYFSWIFRSTPVKPQQPAFGSTLREDAELLFQKSPLSGAALVFTAVSLGGIWSLLGSCAAVVLDGDEGSERYDALKRWLNG